MASGALKDYIGHGDAADRPAAPDLATGVLGFWWAEDTSELSLWDGTAWQEDILAGGGGTGVVETIVAGTNVTVDDTDPANPIVSAAVGSASEAWISGSDVVVTGVTTESDICAITLPAGTYLVQVQASVLGSAAQSPGYRLTESTYTTTYSSKRLSHSGTGYEPLSLIALVVLVGTTTLKATVTPQTTNALTFYKDNQAGQGKCTGIVALKIA